MIGSLIDRRRRELSGRHCAYTVPVVLVLMLFSLVRVMLAAQVTPGTGSVLAKPDEPVEASQTRLEPESRAPRTAIAIRKSILGRQR